VNTIGFIVAPILAAAIVQTLKWATELTGYDVKPIAAQWAAVIVAFVMAHYPPLRLYMPVVQPELAAVLTAALSYVAHDLANAAQALGRALQAWLSRIQGPVPSPGGGGGKN
jgi:hypothetical protein